MRMVLVSLSGLRPVDRQLQPWALLVCLPSHRCCLRPAAAYLERLPEEGAEDTGDSNRCLLPVSMSQGTTLQAAEGRARPVWCTLQLI